MDRDGVIIKDVGYLNQLEQIRFLPQTTTALRYAFKRGYKIIIITNQSVVGRGIISINKLSKILI